MNETEIRNKNGSYKPHALDIAKRAKGFAKEILRDFPNTHPDFIHQIISDSSKHEYIFKIAMDA